MHSARRASYSWFMNNKHIKIFEKLFSFAFSFSCCAFQHRLCFSNPIYDAFACLPFSNYSTAQKTQSVHFIIVSTRLCVSPTIFFSLSPSLLLLPLYMLVWNVAAPFVFYAFMHPNCTMHIIKKSLGWFWLPLSRVFMGNLKPEAMNLNYIATILIGCFAHISKFYTYTRVCRVRIQY